jgi:drug/metabolite transporter (DMT)-like permease
MPRWLVLTALSALLFGVNAALIEVPEKFVRPPFPMTLGYVVWSGTMLLCAGIALRRVGWGLERGPRALAHGSAVGLLGSAGTILWFAALRGGPAYLVVPIVSLYPVVTVVLAVWLLGERTRWPAALGIVLALAAIVLLSLPEPDGGPARGGPWLAWSLCALFMFGAQGWLVKASGGALGEESLFFYMAAAAAALAPVAWGMTDFRQPINWGWTGPGLTAAIQLPNAVGALLSIYAYRAGKVILVGPIIGLYPLVTIVLSLALYRRVPGPALLAGMALALVATALIAVAEAVPGAPKPRPPESHGTR